MLSRFEVWVMRMKSITFTIVKCKLHFYQKCMCGFFEHISPVLVTFERQRGIYIISTRALHCSNLNLPTSRRRLCIAQKPLLAVQWSEYFMELNLNSICCFDGFLAKLRGFFLLENHKFLQFFMSAIIQKKNHELSK